MPIKPVDRHLFLQGGRCFFCKDLMTRSEASVEHLNPRSHGGENDDENCVACCKAVNSIFGRMSIKEKFRVILNQEGTFICPNKLTPNRSLSESRVASDSVTETEKSPPFAHQWVVTDLEKRGISRPKTIKTLKSTIRAVAPASVGSLSEQDLDRLITDLQRQGLIQITETKVQYKL